MLFSELVWKELPQGPNVRQKIMVSQALRNSKGHMLQAAHYTEDNDYGLWNNSLHRKDLISIDAFTLQCKLLDLTPEVTNEHTTEPAEAGGV